jgi:hypothetical protein
MQTGLELSRAASAGPAITYLLRHIADSHRALGQVDEALLAIDEGLAACAEHDNRTGESELLRVRGEILAADPGADALAEESFRTALAIARAQGAVVYVRRTVPAFAAFLRSRRRDGEADRLETEDGETS